MKNGYEKPEIQVVLFSEEDVVLTSGEKVTGNGAIGDQGDIFDTANPWEKFGL